MLRNPYFVDGNSVLLTSFENFVEKNLHYHSLSLSGELSVSQEFEALHRELLLFHCDDLLVHGKNGSFALLEDNHFRIILDDQIINREVILPNRRYFVVNERIDYLATLTFWNELNLCQLDPDDKVSNYPAVSKGMEQFAHEKSVPFTAAIKHLIETADVSIEEKNKLVQHVLKLKNININTTVLNALINNMPSGIQQEEKHDSDDVYLQKSFEHAITEIRNGLKPYVQLPQFESFLSGVFYNNFLRRKKQNHIRYYLFNLKTNNELQNRSNLIKATVEFLIEIINISLDKNKQMFPKGGESAKAIIQTFEKVFGSYILPSFEQLQHDEEQLRIEHKDALDSSTKPLISPEFN